MDYLETAVAYRAIDNLKTLIGDGPAPALRAKAFVRQTIASALSLSEEAAAARWGESGPGVVKAVIAAIARDDIDPDATAFLALAVERSVIGRLQRLRRVPFNTRTTKVTAGSIGYWVSEAAPIPMSRPALAGETLRPLKVAGLIAATKESVQNPQAEALLLEDLLNAVAGVLDAAFLSSDPGVTDERPAGIANGAPTIVATGNIANDMAALAEAFAGDLTTTALVTTPSVALGLALGAGGNPLIDVGPNGGRLFNIPLFTTRHIALSSSGAPLLMVDAAGITANWEDIELSQSGHTTLAMADDPGSPAQMVGMWQTNSVAMKAVLSAAWNVSRAGAVAVLEGL